MANTPDSIDKVGIGIDLLGGPEVLTLLRAIRQEMQGVATLAGQGQGKGDIYGPSHQARYEQEIKAREKAEMDSIKRVSRAKAEANKPITDAEIDTKARASLRAAELTRRSNAKAEQLEREHQAKLTQIARQAEEDRASIAAAKRTRIQSYSQQPDILQRDLTAQRRDFRRYRNDPARDMPTDVMRRILAEEVRGQRIAQQEQRKVEAEQKRIADEQARAVARARQDESIRRSYDPAVLARNIDPRQIRN